VRAVHRVRALCTLSVFSQETAGNGLWSQCGWFVRVMRPTQGMLGSAPVHRLPRRECVKFRVHRVWIGDLRRSAGGSGQFPLC
jgi:hypothetical protein